MCLLRFQYRNRYDYRKTAIDLGKALAHYNIRLIYGGGRIGLMGELADSVLSNGGEVTVSFLDSCMKRGSPILVLPNLK